MDLAAHRRDRTVAFAAAFVLLLQAFFTAWATGAAASGAMPVDAWGNPLCITAADDAAPGGESGAVEIANCCAMGCGVSATALPGPAGAMLAAADVRFGTGTRFVASDRSLDHGRDHDPGAPRAPPVTA